MQVAGKDDLLGMHQFRKPARSNGGRGAREFRSADVENKRLRLFAKAALDGSSWGTEYIEGRKSMGPKA
jgi:hypothetical protein